MTAPAGATPLAAEPIASLRLRLEPLREADADEMVDVLSDPALYAVIGGGPPDLDALRSRYRFLAPGRSPDGRELWLNWVVRLRADEHSAVGTVQATVRDDLGQAEVAWVVGTPWQGEGYAGEAACALTEWLREKGVRRLIAHVHPEHTASEKVAARAGLRPTAEVHDGERRWASDAPEPGEAR